MSFNASLSLEHITLVKVATLLWNQNDIRDLMVKQNWKRKPSWELSPPYPRIKQKVYQLQLPELLVQKILYLIHPIGLQILNWMREHAEMHSNLSILRLPNEFYWTLEGTIDKRRTAEILIEDQNINITTHYKLAYVNCLEKDIFELENKMLVNGANKEDLLGMLWSSVGHKEWELVKYWKHVKHERKKKIRTERAFKAAVKFRNQAAVKYFLEKFDPKEREECVLRAAKIVTSDDYYSHDDTSLLYYLLLQLREEQQIEVFKINPSNILIYFLEWPLQIFFPEIANRTKNLLSDEDYCHVLKRITMKGCHEDYNYQKLFHQFWQQSNRVYKESVIKKCTNEGDLLSHIFSIRNIQNIKLILKEASPLQKKSVISRYAEQFRKRWFLNYEWDVLIVLIQECLPSKEDMKIFKEKYEEIFKGRFSKEVLEKWDKIFI